MYQFWVRASPQLLDHEKEQLYREIVNWGAKTVSTGTQTEDWAFVSRVRPSTFLNRKIKEGVVTLWGYLFTSQIVKPRRNPKKRTGEDKIKEFSRLKKRCEKTLGPGG